LKPHLAASAKSTTKRSSRYPALISLSLVISAWETNWSRVYQSVARMLTAEAAAKKAEGEAPSKLFNPQLSSQFG
jgi:hypothetical protein